MATDVKESDTDDHGTPASSKRQCTSLAKVSATCWKTGTQSDGKDDTAQKAENAEYEDAERHAREKLKRWQICQLVKGCVDNNVNQILENYIVNGSSCYPIDVSRFYLFGGNDMEDSAITMAIQNHGLVQSAGLVTQSHAFYSDETPGYWTNNEHSGTHNVCPSSRDSGIEGFSSSLANTSASLLRLNNSDVDQHSRLNWDADKIDDSKQQETFLERAVAEAIKKKGLGALSVDYG